MAERSKQWLLVGTGALFGSLSTVALLRLFSRWAGKRQVKGLLTSCSVISDWNGKEKLFGRCGTRYNGAPDGLVYSDLLKDEVVSEQLTRNIQFFGMESQQKVTESYVVVIGLGGVGSHAASMLLRSGVGRLLLVDFDQVALLAACVRRGLRVLSAMGAGARADPTRIRVADLRESSIDPLSRSVRHRLRKDYGIEGGIAVVFSLEKPKVKLLPFKGLTGEEENPSDYQIVPGFRVRIIPVLGTIPAIFGQVMASYVATQLAGLCVQTEPVVNLDLDHYRILHQRLLEHEELIYGSAVQVLDMDTRQWRLSLCSAYWFILNHMGLLCYAWFGVIFTTDVEEVMYVVKELWHGRSARDQSQKDVGRKMWRSVNELMLVRWDKSRPATVNNLIPLKFTEAGAHESTMIDRIREEEPEFYTMVANVLKRAEEEFALR
ncbi:tRNA threonylcarbamoyladenosine dehydratase-like isoform X3 [Phoenix dactylifera]|uniref:tRNA threonylcarbamoyladenosine dehydratase-like isoform X3 n=1 Tax=Phoenix dactylifera TaxID=42345 RepID=A0A8B8ZL51_PHODC|nr:tRNA threonylcarbamoyladenosine dehydratase-like isoform X3 [Phoenix dactylifera]